MDFGYHASLRNIAKNVELWFCHPVAETQGNCSDFGA